MLDFTKEIELSKPWQKKYSIARSILYALFIAAVFMLVYKILFPSITFDHFFKLQNALKNTISNPGNSEGQPLKHGALSKNTNLVFDTALTGNFSDISISINLEKDSSPIGNDSISVKKSYPAFFYPLGQPMGFRDGSLLSVGENYYMISDQTARKFSSTQIAQTLGYTKNSFMPITQAELEKNKLGAEISDATYPNGALFQIEDEFYQLNNSELWKFVTDRAFLSQHNTNEAIAKDKAFMSKFEISENMFGFANGTLAASSDAVFILSNGKSFAFDSPETFQAMGYDWDSVLQATSEELGIYKKQRMALRQLPDSDGTIFLDTQDNAYYLIENNQKRPLLGENILKAYLKNKPVLVNNQSLTVSESCVIKKDLLSLRTYSCTIPLEKFKDLPGNNYQFTGTFKNQLHLNELHAVFYTSMKSENVFKSLSKIKDLIKNNYTTK